MAMRSSSSVKDASRRTSSVCHRRVARATIFSPSGVITSDTRRRFSGGIFASSSPCLTSRSTSADALAVNDRGYSLARTNADLPEGTAGLPWRPAAQRLQQQFEQHWANSRECPELRPLRL